MSNTLHALVGLLLLTAPASLGIATYSDQVTVPYLEDRAGNETDGEVVETFEASFDQPIETGRLDLRVDHGKVKVVGWDKNAYEIEVRQTPTDDDRTQVNFTDASQGSTLDLTVIVDRQRQSNVHVDSQGQEVGNERVDKAIVARVPASATYEEVYACEGQESTVNQVLNDGISRIPGVESGDEDRGCVPAGDQPEMHWTVQVDTDDDDQHLNATWGAIGLQGRTLRMQTEYGDLHAEQVDFDTVRVVTDHGDVHASGLTSEDAKLVTDYGEITIDELDATAVEVASDHGDLDLSGEADDLDLTTAYGDVFLDGTAHRANVTTDHGRIDVNGTVDAGTLVTDYGDVVLRLTPQTSGTLDVDSDHGTISAFVPEGEDYGYSIAASTEHGDIDVGLEQVSNKSTDEEDKKDKKHEKHHEGEEVHVETDGFASRQIQVTMDLDTEYGDIWVANHDEEVEDRPDGDDGEGGGGGSGTSSGTGTGVLDPADPIVG